MGISSTNPQAFIIVILCHVLVFVGAFCFSDIAAFREIFSKAKNIAIITGAGVSAESGVPTFRGAGGYWRKWQAQVGACPPLLPAVKMNLPHNCCTFYIFEIASYPLIYSRIALSVSNFYSHVFGLIFVINFIILLS